MKKNKFSKNWIIKQKRDIYVKQSKIEGYRSRAVYKLKEINDKFKFLKVKIERFEERFLTPLKFFFVSGI